MANEMLYSSLGDLRVAEIIRGQILMLLADRKVIGNHPALVYVGDAVGTGTAAIKQGSALLDGGDPLGDFAELAPVTNTALTDDSYVVTVSRRAKRYEASDLARITDSVGMLNTDGTFARDAVISAGMKLTNLIANVTDDFTAQEGPGTGVDLDIDSLVRAGIRLGVANADVESGVMTLLHAQQWGDVQIDILTSAAGAVQWAPASQEMIELRGNGFKGTFFGFDVFVSNQVPTINAGADRGGAMFTRGSVLWADATIPPDGDADKLNFGKIMLARTYDNEIASKAWVTNYYCGVTLGIDDAGVTIVSDA